MIKNSIKIRCRPKLSYANVKRTINDMLQKTKNHIAWKKYSYLAEN